MTNISIKLDDGSQSPLINKQKYVLGRPIMERLKIKRSGEQSAIISQYFSPGPANGRPRPPAASSSSPRPPPPA
ncbi:hypothetical protein GWI33_011818 [Rhynchophorus ferrugineus]|uniref:Uncharacterized protein n=1 Tax=Rhynchophorus ferrugineus TaxID=354439 RepID=A0A834MB97_RHYFE|nr:hypothetical protein GWI33_011818 [Rhynchophorus ferrugineus]